MRDAQLPGRADNEIQDAANRHLWMHFTSLDSFADGDLPVMVRGDGPWIWDSKGKRYLDGLSGLFVVNAGYGREELVEAAARQARELPYWPLWHYAHPKAVELSERLCDLAPGDLNRVFFTSGGSESVETAWKLAKQYFKAKGEPGRYKVLARRNAYHGTTLGALAITGSPAIRAPFEPLPPGAVRVANTDFYRAKYFSDDLEAFGRWAADDIELRIEMEGPDSVAAVFLEPVQNSGGCIPPPPGYFQRVREVCDRFGVLLVSDEVICAFGRLGHWFGAERFDYVPDVITCAKGLTSGYSPLGAVLVSERMAEVFKETSTTFVHGYTFGGHPVGAAVALANLDLFEKEDLLGNVRRRAPDFRRVLDELRDLPIVGDVRGEGYFYAIELVKDKATKEAFQPAESEGPLRTYLSPALFDAGLVCRSLDRGGPVIQLAPPLLCTQEQFDLIGQILRDVLSETWKHL